MIDVADTGACSREEAGEKQILEHLATHGLHSMEDYRKDIFSSVVGSPLEPVTNQILRSRLYAYKHAQCDSLLRKEPCAVCGRYVALAHLSVEQMS